MWVCSQCHHFNDNSIELHVCGKCHAKKPEAETPKGRKEHRHASYIKDKKTMYTHPGPFGWKLAHGVGSVERLHSYKDEYDMVAVLDLGTCFSGYGYSLRSDPTKNSTIERVPTCLLVNSKTGNPQFGFDAIDKYREFEKLGQLSDCYFFQAFKTSLLEKEDISFDMMIKDISGKELEAMKVFGYSLLALKKCLFAQLRKDEINVAPERIRWVIPVSTTWTDAAKQFIRRLAERVGIPDDQLLLSLKPEAASFAGQSTNLPPGTNFLVANLGGGTIEMGVYEKTANNGVKEIVCARGGEFGGNCVNEKFIKLLEAIVGINVITEFQKHFPVSYLNLLQEFENAKINMNSENSHVSIKIPRVDLESKCKELTGNNLLTAINNSQFKPVISLHDEKLVIDNNFMKGLFKYPIKEIISTMKEVFQSPETSNTSSIILTGGFASSSLIQEGIRSEFQHKTLVVDESPSLSSIAGSLSYAHEPTSVECRVMKYSYGVGISDDFDPSIHDEAHCLTSKDGSKLAIHIFDVIVRKNQSVQSDTVFESEYLTLERNQRSIEFELYYSTNENPSYVDEVNVKRLGSAVLPFPGVTQETREVKVFFVIRNAEIGLKAVDKTSGQEISVEFDLV